MISFGFFLQSIAKNQDIDNKIVSSLFWPIPFGMTLSEAAFEMREKNIYRNQTKSLIP
jgi:hypothetical protein